MQPSEMLLPANRLRIAQDQYRLAQEELNQRGPKPPTPSSVGETSAAAAMYTAEESRIARLKAEIDSAERAESHWNDEAEQLRDVALNLSDSHDILRAERFLRKAAEAALGRPGSVEREVTELLEEALAAAEALEYSWPNGPPGRQWVSHHLLKKAAELAGRP